jgi:hypothetical protein
LGALAFGELNTRAKTANPNSAPMTIQNVIQLDVFGLSASSLMPRLYRSGGSAMHELGIQPDFASAPVCTTSLKIAQQTG